MENPRKSGRTRSLSTIGRRRQSHEDQVKNQTFDVTFFCGSRCYCMAIAMRTVCFSNLLRLQSGQPFTCFSVIECSARDSVSCLSRFFFSFFYQRRLELSQTQQHRFITSFCTFSSPLCVRYLAFSFLPLVFLRLAVYNKENSSFHHQKISNINRITNKTRMKGK